MTTDYKYFVVRNRDSRNGLSDQWHYGLTLDELAAYLMDGIFDSADIWECMSSEFYDEFNRPEHSPDWSFGPPSASVGNGPHPKCTLYNNVYKWDDSTLPENSNTADCVDWLIANLRKREES